MPCLRRTPRRLLLLRPPPRVSRSPGLVKHFGDKQAVDGVDLTVASGSFYGLAGPNGAGKTTTIRMVTGLPQPDSGSVTLAGARRAIILTHDIHPTTVQAGPASSTRCGPEALHARDGGAAARSGPHTLSCLLSAGQKMIAAPVAVPTLTMVNSIQSLRTCAPVETRMFLVR